MTELWLILSRGRLNHTFHVVGIVIAQRRHISCAHRTKTWSKISSHNNLGCTLEQRSGDSGARIWVKSAGHASQQRWGKLARSFGSHRCVREKMLKGGGRGGEMEYRTNSWAGGRAQSWSRLSSDIHASEGSGCSRLEYFSCSRSPTSLMACNAWQSNRRRNQRAYLRQ